MDTAEQSDLVPDISSDGDIVLVVGPGNVRLKIHSQCLRCASKVFDAMFGPHWSEGQGLSTESPREISLVDTDANALRTICLVIHHRNADVPQSLTPHEILQIAIEADKYDLTVALRYASIQWAKPRCNAGRVDMGYLLTAAFLFRDMDMFVAHTLNLMLDYTGSYLGFSDDEFISQFVPSKTFHLLEERRTRMRAELSEILIQGKNAKCSCGWGENRGNTYIRILSKYGQLSKMLEVPISDIVKEMENFSMEDMDTRWHSGLNLDRNLHKAPACGEMLYVKLADLLLQGHL
ncbi:MAG: hypothetical protein M1818_007373 [Claussenomyces sp. TS43310]|nr:MAG: hypothetical protein M1818_007373 [Claussenomyces sp. TS43310]